MALQRRLVSIAFVDGTVTRNPITPKTEMYFERTYKIGMDQLSTGSSTATNLYKLAWEVTRMSGGGVIAALETWAESVVAIDIEIEDIAPFEEAAAGDSSPSSASPPG